MKIGISTGYEKLPSIMKTFEGYEISHIQIGSLPAEVDGNYNEIFNAVIDFKVKNPYVELSIHSYPFNLAERVDPVRKVWIELAERTISMASKIGAKFVNFHLGYGIDSSKRTQHSKIINDIIPVITRLVDYGYKNGIEIHIENLYPEQRNCDSCRVGDRVSDFEKIFNSITQESLKLCYDYGHGNLDEHGIEILHKFSNRLGSIHAHDNDQLADIHWPIGSQQFNTINWVKEINYLNCIGFEGVFILESYSQDQIKSLAYLKELKII